MTDSCWLFSSVLPQIMQILFEDVTSLPILCLSILLFITLIKNIILFVLIIQYPLSYFFIFCGRKRICFENTLNYKGTIINNCNNKKFNREPMQDSLQNLSPKRKSVSPSAKDDKQKALLQQLKQKFITSLSKLQSSQTRQIGIQEIRLSIDKNRQPEHLRLFLSLMKNLKIEGTSSSTKEHEILVFSILAEIFKQNLIDPIDKPTPSRVKTCFRIVEILHVYFKDSSNTVQQACARVLIDLGKHVLGAQQQKSNLDTQTFITLLFSPLASILKSGVDKASQSTASVCINQQIQYWKAHFNIKKYRDMFEYICPEMLAVSLRLNCEYQQIFMALQTVIQVKGLDFFNPVNPNNNSNINSTTKLIQFVSKILGVINKINDKVPQQMASNFNVYMCKVNVCGILEKIGELLRDKPQIKAKLDELDVAQCLQKATRNRVIQVQMSASKALKAWNGQITSPTDKRPGSTPKIGSRNNYISLEQARNTKKRQRSTSKEQKLKLQRELNHIKQDLNKLVKGGWGPHNRANNFVKKNTGGGGGYCSKMDQSPSPKANKNKSHKQHIQELRKFIKDSSKQHGNKEKFVFYEQKQKSNSNKKSNSNTHKQLDNFQNYLDENYGSKKPIKKNKNNPTFNYGGNENENKKQKNEGQQFQFVLQSEQGDQGVALPVSPKNSEQLKYQNNPYEQQEEYKVKFDTEDRQWLSQHRQALNKINSSNLSGILDQKQMAQLLKQQELVLNIQSRQQLKSNLTQKQEPYDKSRAKDFQNRGSDKKIGFGQMTFNTQKANEFPKTDANNINGVIMEQKQKRTENVQKPNQNVESTKEKSIQAVNNKKNTQVNQPIVKKSRKSLDDDYQIKQQKPLNNKQEKKVQMKKTNDGQKPSQSNQKQLLQNKNIPKINSIQKQKEKNRQVKMAPITIKNIDQAQISLDGCSQKMSDSIPIVEIMNESDFQGFNWNPFRKQTEGTVKNSEQISFKRKVSQNNQDLRYSDYNKDSLVLSLSKDQSRSRSPDKKENKKQFLLTPQTNNKPYQNSKPPQNPNSNKFNSFDHQNNEELEEEILDESKYQQSLPYGNKLLNKPIAEIQRQPIKPQSYPSLSPYISSARQSQQRQNIQEFYKRSVEHGEHIDRINKGNSGMNRSNDEVGNQIYQQMIKNPPKSHIGHRLDKVSQLTPQQSQEKIGQHDQYQQQENENITDTWQKVLEHVENNQLNQAYALTFKIDDPIYLLRLMLITQTPLKKLTPANTSKLWQKFLQIYQHRFIDNIFVQMFTSVNKLNGGKGLSRSLSVEEINDTLVELYELSGRTKGKLSFGAASLYNQIQQAINNRNEK